MGCILDSSRVCSILVRAYSVLPDTSATRHFDIKTLWDTSAPISTHFDTKKPKNVGTRHFDTSAVIEEKPGHFDPGQFR